MWTIATTTMKTLIRNKPLMALLILAPLTLIFILGSALSAVFNPQDQELKPVKLAYVVRDQGSLADGIRDYLAEMEAGGFMTLQSKTSRDEIVRALSEEEAEAGLIVPESFSSDVLSGGEASWEYLTGSDRMQNQVGELLLASFISETNRVQATVMTLGVAPSVEGGATDRSYVETGRLAAEGKDYTALQYYASTMLVMFLLYSGMTVAISIVREKESHRLARLQSMPIPPNRIVMGKILGNMLLAILQVLVIVLVTGLAFGADWGDDWMTLSLVCLATILASMAFGCVAAFFLRSTKAVGGVLGPLIAIMTFISGGMSPTDGTVLESAKPFTLNYWASDSLVKIMIGQSGAGVYSNIVVLLVIAFFLILLAGFAYRKVGFHE